MKKIFPLLFTFLFTIVSLLTTHHSYSQLTFSVNENFSNPDFRVLVGENIGLADLDIQFGRNISFENFSVGITEFTSKADFIITNRSTADFTIGVRNDMSRPDLILQVREQMSFPDVAIEFRETGKADYLIYSEIGDLNDTEILMALLPIIHRVSKFKFKRLGEILLENDIYLQNTTCEDIVGFLKKHGKRRDRLNKKKLQSSWLRNVEAYEFKSIHYILAEIKEMNADEGEGNLQVFKTDVSTWRKFLDTNNDFDYEERFRQFIYENPCGCK
jgi:hypothetical protein